LAYALSSPDLKQQLRHLKKSYYDAKDNDNLDEVVTHWSAIIDNLWADWDNCFLLDEWINELAFLRQQIEASKNENLASQLAKGAFAAYSIRDMGNPDFLYWEKLNLHNLEGDLDINERLMRSLQCMIHYTWGVADQPKSALIIDYL